ncbi:class III lanthionine synthetase LanKC [Nonomuraea sp. NPDC050310]|uniref:class III lanthionine synthetase LanKC n=1 Tax=Nonomuraea sp. NPDC050310 TaxID=3154935 RepID=UPI0033CADD8C
MDGRHAMYCLADPLFYDTPAGDFDLAVRQAPPSWSRREQDDWIVYRPPAPTLPDQGWKIHVSAGLDNAEAVLEKVWAYCVANEVPFKVVRARHLLHLRNAEHAERGSSGKLAALYPADEAQLERICTELAAELDGEHGPSILSDLRIGDGPLYVRYGAIAERYCTGPDGRVERAVARPDGTLVPDSRSPVFAPPPWVHLPHFLEPHLAARRNATFDGVPYTVEAVVRFTNGGGIYHGVDRRTGRQVVLKEARPHAGLDAEGRDALARLDRERAALERLAGLASVPALLGEFTVADHRFMVTEHVPARPLDEVVIERHPLLGRADSAEARAAYASWAMDLCVKVEAAVADVHRRGLAFGAEPHAGHVRVRPDGEVMLTGFEGAGELDAGLEQDRYALACLRLALFLPLTELFALDRLKAVELAEVIRAGFPVPGGFLDDAVRTITGDRTVRHLAAWHSATLPDPERWPRLRRSLAKAILDSATPERDDRLFPGGIEQFTTGGLNLAHGAAGVLHALAVTGAGRFPEYERWLAERAVRPGQRLGFYDGLHGIAHVLAGFGDHARALDLVATACRERWEDLGLGLHSGLSGIGLNLLHLAEVTGVADLHTRALKVVDVVASRLERENFPGPGLLHGATGPALLLLRAGEYDLAERALRLDLARCRGLATPPGLGCGAAGTAWVLEEFLTHRPGVELEAARTVLDRAARPAFSLLPGLFNGRAGTLAYLARRPDDPGVEEQLQGLGWHAVRYRADLAFPGEGLTRLSMDLATGSAGVLLAVGAALHDERVSLPLMLSPPSPQTHGDTAIH